jgi:hypothetical protein
MRREVALAGEFTHDEKPVSRKLFTPPASIQNPALGVTQI